MLEAASENQKSLFNRRERKKARKGENDNDTEKKEIEQVSERTMAPAPGRTAQEYQIGPFNLMYLQLSVRSNIYMSRCAMTSPTHTRAK